mmetsp:Transcript_32792/g.71503  ORF Transcript_32792/g.71503 Transcript_32792/m.71503 type:complete len:412 (+) Transcript_32792:1170-2405(+)
MFEDQSLGASFNTKPKPKYLNLDKIGTDAMDAKEFDKMNNGVNIFTAKSKIQVDSRTSDKLINSKNEATEQGEKATKAEGGLVNPMSSKGKAEVFNTTEASMKLDLAMAKAADAVKAEGNGDGGNGGNGDSLSSNPPQDKDDQNADKTSSEKNKDESMSDVKEVGNAFAKKKTDVNFTNGVNSNGQFKDSSDTDSLKNKNSGSEESKESAKEKNKNEKSKVKNSKDNGFVDLDSASPPNADAEKQDELATKMQKVNTQDKESLDEKEKENDKTLKKSNSQLKSKDLMDGLNAKNSLKNALPGEETDQKEKGLDSDTVEESPKEIGSELDKTQQMEYGVVTPPKKEVDPDQAKQKILETLLNPTSAKFDKHKFCKQCNFADKTINVNRSCCNHGMISRLDNIKQNMKNEIIK